MWVRIGGFVHEAVELSLAAWVQLITYIKLRTFFKLTHHTCRNLRPLIIIMEEINDAMPQTEPQDLDGPIYVNPLKAEKEHKALQINNDIALTLAQKIDEIAELRNWFRGDTCRIDDYLSTTTLSASDLAAEIAAPIDEAYSTADHGWMYYETEGIARSQRKLYPPEKALELWGPRTDFEKPNEEAKKNPGTETQLWDLWYSILHSAKRIAWDDDGKQGKLVDLVKALKARPDPPPPNPMTIPLSKNWIWSSGKVWSATLMLGPSARESWNDGCGCGAGWTPVDIAAWTNVNAFVARMVSSGVADMFYLYGEWALQDLEEKWSAQNDHQVGGIEVVRETVVRIVAVWVIIAGKEIYEQREKDSKGVDGNEVDINKRGRNFPWVKFSHGVTGARWTWWKRRFEQEAQDDGLDEGVRELATQAAKLIQRFEKNVF